MTRPRVVVLDYGSGNVHSATKALDLAGADVELTGDVRAAEKADGLVVPGVGAFVAVMAALSEAGGDRIIENRLADGKPVLGICVGMQIMFEHGVEGGVGTAGLGRWQGTVERLEADVLPHMGWNTVDAPEDSVLFDGIRDERFYFVHSYAAGAGTSEAQTHGPKPIGWKVTTATHGQRFVAALEDGLLCATQFHPEKSGEAGIRLLSNWISTLR